MPTTPRWWRVGQHPALTCAVGGYQIDREGATMGLINAGRASEVGPGEIKAFTVAGRELAVANVDGDLYAFDNWCTHESCTFSDEGELEDGKLVCTCHFGEFDPATGEVLGGPPWEPLGVYELAVEGDDLLIDPRIDDAAAS